MRLGFYFQFCLATSVNPLPLEHHLSFQCLSVPPVAAISWSLESGRMKLLPKEVSLPSWPAYSYAASLPSLFLALTPASPSAARTAQQAWMYWAVWLCQGPATHTACISEVLLWTNCAHRPNVGGFRCDPFFSFCLPQINSVNLFSNPSAKWITARWAGMT